MSKVVAYGLSASILIAGVTLTRASTQDRTLQPGQPTQGKVWIQNRGESEAVPVLIESTPSSRPLQVQVVGTPMVRIGSGDVVVRAARQLWEYRVVNVAVTEDPTAMLNAAGADGWEATGVAFADQKGRTIVLKRPR